MHTSIRSCLLSCFGIPLTRTRHFFLPVTLSRANFSGTHVSGILQPLGSIFPGQRVSLPQSIGHVFQQSPFFIGIHVSGAVCSPVLGSHIPGQTISFSQSHFAGSNFWACVATANARTKMQAF